MQDSGGQRVAQATCVEAWMVAAASLWELTDEPKTEGIE